MTCKVYLCSRNAVSWWNLQEAHKRTCMADRASISGSCSVPRSSWITVEFVKSSLSYSRNVSQLWIVLNSLYYDSIMSSVITCLLRPNKPMTQRNWQENFTHWFWVCWSSACRNLWNSAWIRFLYRELPLFLVQDIVTMVHRRKEPTQYDIPARFRIKSLTVCCKYFSSKYSFKHSLFWIKP